MNQGVPYLDLKPEFQALRERWFDALAEIGARAGFILGDNVKGFQQEAADYVGSRYAVGVANGTDALEIALNAAYLIDVLQVLECDSVELQLRDGNTQCVVVPIDDDSRLEEYIYILMPMRL